MPVRRRLRSEPRLLFVLLAAPWPLAGSACQAAPKNFATSDWSEFARVNPNDIAVSPVTGIDLPREVRLDRLRDDLRDELLSHKYSPLSYAYVDAAGQRRPGDVRVDLVVKRFDVQRYTMARSMRVVGEFLFRETGDGGSDRVIAAVQSDQTIDLADEVRRGASLDEAVRIAGARFVGISLAGMPVRNVDGR